ncbi:hypothetical protein Cgig2_007463 [Carnegiea gigantea]|uniref:Uncharacterized protein n=1 Tax=Carnegiea gigantea TaxID=171969 RepID=A0A9Q1K577_9CARY|nr:hypothetical protein Cgig2_007463 [Carnegiea gigantea]
MLDEARACQNLHPQENKTQKGSTVVQFSSPLPKMADGNPTINHTPEEADQLRRSNKKMKRSTMIQPTDNEGLADVDMDDCGLGSPHVPETLPSSEEGNALQRPTSYRDTLQRNNPNLSFDTRENPVWEDTSAGDVSEDDEPPEEDDLTCPTILLTAAKK